MKILKKLLVLGFHHGPVIIALFGPNLGMVRKINSASGNARCHSVQNPLSSGLLSKNVSMKIYRSVMLRVFLYGCETWSFTPREERK